MLGEYIGYDDKLKKMIIYNEEIKDIASYDIGECFVDFMEIDYSSYSEFYDNLMIGMGYSSEAYTEQLHNFIKKYPLIIDYAINFADRKIKNENINIKEYSNNLAYSELSYLKLVWNLIYDYKNPYINNLTDIINHPYMKSSERKEIALTSLDDLEPGKIKEAYKEIFAFCFDVELNEKINLLNAKERYYLYNKLNPTHYLADWNIESKFVFKKIKNDIGIGIEYKSLLHVNDDSCKANSYESIENFLERGYYNNPLSWTEWFDQNIDVEIIKSIKSLDLEQYQLFPTNSLDNIVHIEFQKMLENNIKMKKCKNCGKYFILKGDYATDYCDRIPEGENTTCKRIATTKARKNKINSNPILQEFQKAYKRNYAKVSTRKISRNEFQIWVDEAIKKRELVAAEFEQSHDEQIIKDFKAYLGNK